MRVSILLIIIFISKDTFGQKGNLWLTKEFWETTDSTTAHYKRVVNSYNSDNTINVTDFLKTGEKYFEGSVAYINGGLYFIKGVFIKGTTVINGQAKKYKEERGYAKPKFIKEVRNLAKTEILRQIPKNERQPEYKVGVIFKKGKPIQIIHLRKNLDEKKINFQNVDIPDYTFIEKGEPIESLTLGLKIIKVE